MINLGEAENLDATQRSTGQEVTLFIHPHMSCNPEDSNAGDFNAAA